MLASARGYAILSLSPTSAADADADTNDNAAARARAHAHGRGPNLRIVGSGPEELFDEGLSMEELSPVKFSIGRFLADVGVSVGDGARMGEGSQGGEEEVDDTFFFRRGVGGV